MGPGKNPARAYLERKMLKVGSTLDCAKNVVDGSVTYRFPGGPFDDYEMDCFKSR